MLLSVIIPVYNEEEIVAETYRVLEDELKDICNWLSGYEENSFKAQRVQEK